MAALWQIGGIKMHKSSGNWFFSGIWQGRSSPQQETFLISELCRFFWFRDFFFFQKLVLTTCLDRLFRPPPLLEITVDGHETRYVTRGHPGTNSGVFGLRDRQKGAGLEAKEGKNVVFQTLNLLIRFSSPSLRLSAGLAPQWMDRLATQPLTENCSTTR